MYELIRTTSVHSMAAPASPTPHRSRDEELTLQLAATFEALLTVLDELGAEAGLRSLVAEHVARLQDRAPLRLSAGSPPDPARLRVLRRRTRALASRALVLAESRRDPASAELAEHAASGATATTV